MEAIRERFGEQAEFLTIYIKEAHPEDEWQMNVNDKESVCYRQPTTLAERVAIANDFVSRFDYRIPLVVDPLHDPADDAYAGWPERLYVLGADGRVAYKGGVGPFGYNPDELETWLEQHVGVSGGKS